MKGFIKKAAAGLVFGAGSMALVGCQQYRQHVDPCWPERYDNMARQTVRSTFDAQCANGHVLDQTIWNWDFEHDEKGNPTDRLTLAAQDRLKYLIRRRPVPDGKLYLQTANDLPAGTDIANVPGKRQELDSARIAMVQRYLNSYMAGRASQVAWDIAVHDPAPVYLPASVVGSTPSNYAILGAYPKLTTNFQGVMGTVTGFTLSAGGAGGGGGGAGGGGGVQAAPGQGGNQGGGDGGGAGAPPSN